MQAKGCRGKGRSCNNDHGAWSWRKGEQARRARCRSDRPNKKGYDPAWKKSAFGLHRVLIARYINCNTRDHNPTTGRCERYCIAPSYGNGNRRETQMDGAEIYHGYNKNNCGTRRSLHSALYQTVIHTGLQQRPDEDW